MALVQVSYAMVSYLQCNYINHALICLLADGTYNDVDIQNFMRLEGGETPGAGDVLIRNGSGLIAPICGRNNWQPNWSWAAANVTCKELGYTDGAWAYTRYSFHGILDHAYSYSYEYGSTCYGNETSVRDCLSSRPHISPCREYSYNYYANGVICLGLLFSMKQNYFIIGSLKFSNILF